VISGPKIRFYAGAPLITEEGYALGTICVLDYQPRKLNADQENALSILAHHVVALLKLRRGSLEITSVKETEEALRKSEARFKELFDQAPVGYHELDVNARIVSVNHTELSMLGYQESEMIGRPVWDVMVEKEQCRVSIFGKLREEIPVGSIERTFVRKDGSHFEGMITDLVLHDENGKVRGIRGIVQDISDRKRAQKSLQEKSRQLQALNEAMTAFLEQQDWKRASAIILKNALELTESEYGFIGVVVAGPVLRILAHQGLLWDQAVNRKFYDKAMETYEGKGYLEFPNLNNLFGSVITSGKTVVSNEPSIDSRSGGNLPAGHPPLHHFLGVPILYGNSLLGMIGVANRQAGYTSVEEEKLQFLSQTACVLYQSYQQGERETQLQQELLQSQKIEAIGRLAGGVAHDFNNVLMAISGYCELISLKLPPSDPLQKDVAEILKASDQGGALTKQLLAFSRKQVLVPKVIDLNDTISRMEPMLRRLIREDVELITLLGSQLANVKADPGQLEQVILNLAVNARDAMPSGGKLIVETANVVLDNFHASANLEPISGQFVMLSVADSGVGMDDETKAHIFEPFFTTKEKGKGTGLGLSTVYGIVKQSGGYVFVESELGQGTIVRIYLPSVEEEAQTMKVLQHSPTIKGGRTILVVDDNKSVLNVISSYLRSHGYSVLAAGHAQEALELSAQQEGEIDLLITDVVMPQISGRELARQLTENRKETKVLFISGYSDEAVAQQGELKKGSTFLQKPISLHALLSKVAELLN
jgi:PAS domain S-box-containing protein